MEVKTMTTLENLKAICQWAFGKEGVNLTVYTVFYFLIYYWDTLKKYIPEPILFVIVGVIINLDNNALKSKIKEALNKSELYKKIVFYMKNNKSFNEALEILEEKEQGTIIMKNSSGAV
jgi:hypothetical protein